VPEILFSLLLVATAVALLMGFRNARMRRLAQERLDRIAEADLEEEVDTTSTTFRVNPIWSVGAGVLAAIIMVTWTGMLVLSVCAGFVVGVIVLIMQEIFVAKQMLRMEEQLADCIDLIVSGLRAGVGMLDALETTSREARRPLKPVLEEAVARVRLGDDPTDVFNDIAERHQLESFRLFAFTLTVHWEVGGSLAPTLSTVGRTIRDRIEVSRRVKTQSAEAQISSIGILGIVYFLLLLMYRADPDRVSGFVNTSGGAAVLAGVVALQGVGLYWMKRLTKLPI